MNQIETTHSGSIARVTLNRPGQHNAISLAMWLELAAIFTALDKDTDTRVIILEGAGKSFCAGADISEFGEARSTQQTVDIYQRAVDDCIEAISNVSKPTIAVVRGYCLGGGCGLATACDFRLADATTQIGIPAAKLSIVYGLRETQNVLALVGLANAKRILFMAERFDAHQAHSMGLVNEIADDASQLADEWADNMSKLAPLTIAGAKSMLNGFAMGEGKLDVAKAAKIIHQASLSKDYAEGRKAYSEKRAPEFKGT